MADFKTQFLLPRRRLGRERKPLSDSSITLYIANLNKLTQLLGNAGVKTEDAVFTNPPAIKEFIEITFPSYHTQKNYYSAIISLLETFERDDDTDGYLDAYDSYRVAGNMKYTAELESGKLHGKQLENVVSKKSIDTLMRKLNTPNTKNDYQFLVLIKTYMTFPMRNELATIKLIDVMEFNEDPEKYSHGNWLVKTDTAKRKGGKVGTPFYKFIFNDFKRSETYGTREIQLPLPLRKIYFSYITKHNITEGDELFHGSNGSPLTPLNLSKFLSRNFQKHLGKNISTTLLRKIYYGSKYSKEIFEDLQTDAHNAGHSPSTAQTIYTTSSIPE